MLPEAVPTGLVLLAGIISTLTFLSLSSPSLSGDALNCSALWSGHPIARVSAGEVTLLVLSACTWHLCACDNWYGKGQLAWLGRPSVHLTASYKGPLVATKVTTKQLPPPDRRRQPSKLVQPNAHGSPRTYGVARYQPRNRDTPYKFCLECNK